MESRGESPGNLGPSAEADRPIETGFKSRLGSLALLAGVIGVAAFLRFAALDADPPPSFSRDFLSDETWWSHNARNHALFGVWRLDDFNQALFAAPLHTFLERLSFFGGVDFWRVRAVSAWAGLVTILSIGLILHREVGVGGSAVGMTLLATDYFCLQYDRSGFVEPVPAAFMALSYALVTRPSRHRVWLFLAGVSAALACLGKINSVFFTIGPLAWPLVRTNAGSARRSQALDVLAIAAGLAIPLMTFGLTFVLPNLAEYLSQNGRLRDETKLHGFHFVLNFLTTSIHEWRGELVIASMMSQALLPTILGLLWLLHAVSQAARKGFRAMLRGLSDSERIALLWIGPFLPYFLLQDNSQDRRYYVFVAPLVLLGVQLLVSRRSERIELNTADLRPKRALIVLVPCFLVALMYLRVPLADALYTGFRDWVIGDSPGLSREGATAISTIMLGALLAPSLWWLLRQVPRLGLTTMTAALIVVLVGGTFQLSRLLRQAASTSFTLRDAGRRFTAQLKPEDRVVDGQPLILESRCRNLILLDRRYCGYPYYGYDFITNYRPTHRMVIDSQPVDAAGFDELLRIQMGGTYRSVPESLVHFPVFPDEGGQMQIVVTAARIVPTGEPAHPLGPPSIPLTRITRSHLHPAPRP